MAYFQENEYALVSHCQCEGSPEDMELLESSLLDYDVGLVITHDTVPGAGRSNEAERTTLRLKYYVVLTSRKDVFPKHFLEKKLGVKISALTQYPASKWCLLSFTVQITW